jgi:TolB protein
MRIGPLTRLSAAVLCLGLVIASWAASTAPAAFPGQNGKIAFTSHRDGQPEVYVMNADGSAQKRLTNATANEGPAFSSDGTKIAFESQRDGNREIYVMNADGSGQTRLTNNPAIDRTPAFSPDGTKVAFESFRDFDSEIYVMNADGSGQVNLTNNAANDVGPVFSPDGSKIAFASNRDGNFQIYVMNANGSGQTNLSNNAAFDVEPAWSPDGAKIAFTSGRDGNQEIYVMNADGSGQTRLTNNPAADRSPALSPDGTKIAFESLRDGPTNAEIYVMNADGSGQTNLTNNAAGDFEPDWGPATTSCPDVQVGFATAQGCFTETAPGSKIFETTQKAWVGGFEIQPRPGGKLVLNTNTPGVSESGAGVEMIFAGFAVPIPVAALPVGSQSGSIQLAQRGTVTALLDLPVSGQAAVGWTQGGTEATFQAEVEVENLASPMGSLITTSSLTSIGQTGGKLDAKLVNGQGFVLNAAEVAIDEISVIPKSLKIPRTLTLKNLLLKFEIHNQKPFWTGRAGIQLPLARGGLDVTGTVFVFDGSPAGGGLAVSGLNKPIAGTPLFFQGVSGALQFTPDLGYDLAAEGSLGPRVRGKQLLTLTGTMQGGDPARQDCPAGDDPGKLVLSSKLTPLDPLVDAGLAEAEMSGRSCVYAGAGRAISLTAAVELAFFNEALAYEASQTGLISTQGANLEGAATLKLPLLPDLPGEVVISTLGTAACADLGFFDGGFGYRWGQSSPPSAFSGCDLGPFRVTVNPRAKRGGTPGSIEVPAGLPLAGFAATGTSGPPPVTVSGPGGLTVSSPADGSPLLSANAVIVPDAAENTTYVIVRKPKAGSWRVDSADPANPVAKVSFAEGLDEATVKGRVATGKKKFRLSYSLRAIPGQKVTLFEQGEGIYTKLGTARGDHGTLSFKPTIAADRRRTIEAEVSQDGLPRALITVAKFKAPKLPKLKAPKLEAKRKKTSLTLSWPRVAGASSYLVEVRAGSEILYRVLSPKHRLRFSDTPKKGTLKATVQAISKIQPPGPTAKLAIRAGRPSDR